LDYNLEFLRLVDALLVVSDEEQILHVEQLVHLLLTGHFQLYLLSDVAFCCFLEEGGVVLGRQVAARAAEKSRPMGARLGPPCAPMSGENDVECAGNGS
jgi:hypothetical protein